MNELQYFTRVAGDNLLRQWLEAQKAEAVKLMAAGTDMVIVHRAQGQYQLADRQLQLLEKAKNLR